MSIKKHTYTAYTLDDGANSFPLPFDVCDSHPEPLIYISADGLSAVVSCLALDESPADPFTEWDEGTFRQFDRSCIHYTPRPSQSAMLSIIRDNPGRVFYISSCGDGYALDSAAPLRLRDALTVDDADGYYIVPEDATDPASYAKGALETYSAWCSGDVYGIMSWRYIRPTQLSPWTLDEDSRDTECWGFYGRAYALQELQALHAEAVKSLQLLPPGTPDPRD